MPWVQADDVSLQRQRFRLRFGLWLGFRFRLYFRLRLVFLRRFRLDILLLPDIGRIGNPCSLRRRGGAAGAEAQAQQQPQQSSPVNDPFSHFFHPMARS